MVTLQRIITEETQKYVQTLNVGDDNYLDMEAELMRNIKISIVQANQSKAKGESSLAMPKYLNFGQIAEILNKVMIIRVIVDGDNSDTSLLGVFNGEIYDTEAENIIYKAAIALNNTLTDKDLKEIISRLMLICEHVYVNKDRDLIAVGNGIFNYKKKKLMPFDEKYVFLSKSQVDYVPNAKLKTFKDQWNIEDWLKDISIDDGVCNLLWQTIGAVLRPYVKWDKTIWLYSTTGNNGKGTFCELLRNMLGPRAHTSIPLSDFSKEFALTPLIGKQAIITDENDVGTFIDKIGIFKAVVTGDIITINRKFKNAINYRFRGMTIQCLNEYPKVKDRSDSFYRRQIFIPFEKSFTGKENKNIKSQYLQDKEVLEYVLYKVLNTDYYELDEPESCKQAKSDYKESNDPIRQFWDEFESQFVWDILPFGFLFDLYKAWYDKNFPRSQQVSRNQFITSLVTMVNRESTTFKCDDTKQQLRPGDKMSKTEKLIGQYDLKDWYATIYQGRDMTKRCTLTSGDLHASYRGLTRK